MRAARQELRLRLTDVPGWHGSIDGRPLRLREFSGVMLEARVPPGRHTVELRYWPTSFTFGLIVALCDAAALLFALVVAHLRSRTHEHLTRNGGATTS